MSAIKYVKSVEQPMLLTLVQRNQCCVACSRRSIEVTVTVRCCLSQIENEYFNVLVRACENESRILNAPHRITKQMHCCSSSITFYNMAVSYQLLCMYYKDQYLHIIAITSSPKSAFVEMLRRSLQNPRVQRRLSGA
ncbi:hypothetical protein T07_5955 [Trichinella nelsoni]|uniref:Uncharacterized protein n=1 Tax=Trichinella nelsoni TaxID=6336 RepID=A0A0V0S5N3_9BILA|nr:hypothetical protein T07_5955 [Trichinella nelsoni]